MSIKGDIHYLEKPSRLIDSVSSFPSLFVIQLKSNMNIHIKIRRKDIIMRNSLIYINIIIHLKNLPYLFHLEFFSKSGEE